MHPRNVAVAAGYSDDYFVRSAHYGAAFVVDVARFHTNFIRTIVFGNGYGSVPNRQNGVSAGYFRDRIFRKAEFQNHFAVYIDGAVIAFVGCYVVF